MTKIEPPWSVQQVAALNRWQHCGWVHPFTCGSDNRMDTAHKAYALALNTDEGALIATPNGWFCPACSYTQKWAHAFMAEPLPPHPLEASPT